jgi:hypothetical protein
MTSGLDNAVAAATAQSLSLSLAAQTALVGKLLSMLMRSRVLDLPDAAALLTDTADMIKEPLDRSPSVKLRSVWQVVRDSRQCLSRSPPAWPSVEEDVDHCLATVGRSRDDSSRNEDALELWAPP